MDKRLKLTVDVPVTHADALRKALGDAGAGRIGNYSHCSFSSKGLGRFTPTAGANPFIGTIGVAEVVEEEQIEVSVFESVIKNVLAAMHEAHPYEEIVYQVYELADY